MSAPFPKGESDPGVQPNWSMGARIYAPVRPNTAHLFKYTCSMVASVHAFGSRRNVEFNIKRTRSKTVNAVQIFGAFCCCQSFVSSTALVFVTIYCFVASSIEIFV